MEIVEEEWKRRVEDTRGDYGNGGEWKEHIQRWMVKEELLWIERGGIEVEETRGCVQIAGVESG